MKKRHYLFWSMGAVLALGFVLLTSQAERGGSVRAEGDNPLPAASLHQEVSGRAAAETFAGEGRPHRGPADAPVTVVEFTDYQCPFCARHFQQTYPKLVREYGDRIRYVVRNFPVVQIHAHAAKAAEAAECAFDQGEFWEYHDRLFENNTALDSKSLKRYAQDVGLDTRRFNECLDSGRKSRIVALDLEDGRRYGVRGTPTFFINGRILVGAQPYEVFQYYLETALREAVAG